MKMNLLPIISVMVGLSFSLTGCQNIWGRVPDQEAGQTQLTDAVPVESPGTLPDEIPAPPTGDEGTSSLRLPPGLLEDPHSACLFHGGSALTCLNGSGWQIYPADGFDLPRYPEALTQCPDGSIYMITQNDLIRLDQAALIDLGEAGGEALICSAGNEIWTVTMESLSRFDGAVWTRYEVMDLIPNSSGVESELVTALAAAPNGDIWLATYTAILRFNGAAWEVITPPGSPRFLMSDDYRRGLTLDAQGKVWAITDDNQVMAFDGTRWSTFGGPENGIMSIAIDLKGQVWAAANRNQIYQLDTLANEWVLQFSSREFGAGKSFYALKALRFDRQGRLWVATDYGLEIYDGTDWTRYQMHTADLYANEVDDIFILGEGPQLPPSAAKEPGTVLGKLVSQSSTDYIGAQAEICLKPESPDYSDDTPCANQAYHIAASVDADGRFIFSDIPAGRYFLMVKVSENSAWLNIVNLGENTNSSNYMVEFEVKPGMETQLGEISAPN